MENPLITVIVPVYKVEPYLERCVKSVINQTYENLEIILVDDGSPDNCGNMCDAFAKQDPRIRVVHKENGGLSSARNAGLDVATGKYIGFVDSDDWIEPDMYAQLYSLLSLHNVKIAACGFRCDFPSGKTVYINRDYPANKEIEVFSKTDALRELILARKITNSVCDKLFEKSLFQTFRFTQGIVNEDFEMMPLCVEAAESVVFCPSPFYHYMMTAESITRGAFKESRFTETDISRRHLQFYKEKYPSLYAYALAKHIGLCLIIIDDASKDRAFSEKRASLIKEVKSFKISDFFKVLDKKSKIKFLLLKINVRLYILFMDLYRMYKHE
ncbi:MAG: glycosyltransferase [Clostridia bacterium]|nr:glycosyltransferase [Clostridia bacterium]MBQ7289140.1 glycosyltransferase [Clostridia bacterium]